MPCLSCPLYLSVVLAKVRHFLVLVGSAEISIKRHRVCLEEYSGFLPWQWYVKSNSPFRKKMLAPITLPDNLYVCTCWTSYFIISMDVPIYVYLQPVFCMWKKMTLKVGYLNHFVKEQKLNTLLLENSLK